MSSSKIHISMHSFIHMRSTKHNNDNIYFSLKFVPCALIHISFSFLFPIPIPTFQRNPSSKLSLMSGNAWGILISFFESKRNGIFAKFSPSCSHSRENIVDIVYLLDGKLKTIGKIIIIINGLFIFKISISTFPFHWYVSLELWVYGLLRFHNIGSLNFSFCVENRRRRKYVPN